MTTAASSSLIPAPAAPVLLTGPEVAEILRVSKATVFRWAQNGTISSVRVNGIVRFRSDDIEALIGQSSNDGQAARPDARDLAGMGGGRDQD